MRKVTIREYTLDEYRIIPEVPATRLSDRTGLLGPRRSQSDDSCLLGTSFSSSWPGLGLSNIGILTRLSACLTRVGYEYPRES